jgi:hypothetical protein
MAGISFLHTTLFNPPIRQEQQDLLLTDYDPPFVDDTSVETTTAILPHSALPKPVDKGYWQKNVKLINLLTKQ